MENKIGEYILTKSAYDDYFKYYSQAHQDQFVANILKFKKNGYVVDIGSSGDSSNSYFFDQFLDWQGIGVDVFDDNYSRKNTKTYKADATKLNYEQIFKENKFPNKIDYLSLDVDDNTNLVMNVIPFKEYEFSVITIEHDYYAYGENRRAEQREFLSNLGYHMLCSDVWFLNPLSPHPNTYFEDWWINPKHISVEEHKFLECDKTQTFSIIERFSNK